MRIRSTLLLVAAAVFALVTVGLNSAAMAQKVTGAIFTTLADGSAVNYNVYDDKEFVYLNGGPNSPNAPCTAAGLPTGVYYFQVTDPSGRILLSTDELAERTVSVNGGYIVDYLGSTHTKNVGSKCGKPTVTVQLYPYYDTPNPGGEYKVWMTLKDDYACDPTKPQLTCNKGFHGFIPSKSKTDNFKAPGDIDTDGDGISDAAEVALGTLPGNPDTDGDGLTDGQEVNDYGTNPLSADTDNDGWTDYEEVMGVLPSTAETFTPTNPNNPDVDLNGNGIPDAGEGAGDPLPPPA